MPGLESSCTASLQALASHQLVVKKNNQNIRLIYCTKGGQNKGFHFIWSRRMCFHRCVCVPYLSQFLLIRNGSRGYELTWQI